MSNAQQTADIKEWLIENAPKEEMIFYHEYWTQGFFIRDTLPGLILRHIPFEERRKQITVINYHVSKSIKLPVVEVIIPERGVVMTMRGNFHDWKISIDSTLPIEMDFMNLTNLEDVWDRHYCEGFPKDRIFGSYFSNPRQFTIEIGSNYDLYTFLYMFNYYLTNKR